MGDREVAAKVAAIQRLQHAEVRYAEAKRQVLAFDEKAAMEAMKLALNTDLENARRELELAKEQADESACDEASKRSADCALREDVDAITLTIASRERS